MDIAIEPGTLRGRVEVPASKSAAHRALICAALAGGESTLSPIQPIKDILVTLDAVRALGAQASLSDRTVTVQGGLERPPQADIDCVESGSTLRFLVPIACALGIGARFFGTGQLPRRPMSPLTDERARHGAVIGRGGGEILSVGGRLSPGSYRLAGNISSQYITGLLLALPLLEGGSELLLTSPLESAGYVDMTIETMSQFGVQVEIVPGGYRVEGGQRYSPRSCAIEGDYSGAAFWLCADALGSQVEVAGLNPGTLQGDRKIVGILEKMRTGQDSLRGTEIDVSQVPDLMPVLAATAAFAEGVTTITGAARLRIKESDRLATVTEGLQALGAQVEEHSDRLVISGKDRLRGGCTVSSYGDHRVAMALSIAALRCDRPVTITGAHCVEKSYPDFYKDFKQLGGNCHVV